MSFQEEALLEELKEEGTKGVIVIAKAVRQKSEEKLGTEVGLSLPKK